MSKSYKNTIPIFAEGKKLKEAIASIVTNSQNPKEEPLDADSCTVLELLRLMEPSTAKGLAKLYRTCPDSGFPGYGVSKKKLKEAMDATFTGPRAAFKLLMKPGSELDDILFEGAMKAREIAKETIHMCRQAVGVR
jgi:tryptophanyl-tRNA synthetase